MAEQFHYHGVIFFQEIAKSVSKTVVEVQINICVVIKLLALLRSVILYRHYKIPGPDGRPSYLNNLLADPASLYPR